MDFDANCPVDQLRSFACHFIRKFRFSFFHLLLNFPNFGNICQCFIGVLAVFVSIVETDFALSSTWCVVFFFLIFVFDFLLENIKG